MDVEGLSDGSPRGGRAQKIRSADTRPACPTESLIAFNAICNSASLSLSGDSIIIIRNEWHMGVW